MQYGGPNRRRRLPATTGAQQPTSAMANFRPHAPLLAANFSTAFSCFLRSHETSLIDGWGSTALEHALYMAELNTRRSRQPSSIAKFLDFLQAAKQLFCRRFALFSRESLQF